MPAPSEPRPPRRPDRLRADRPAEPPGSNPLGLPDRVHFWLRWLGFCCLLVVLFSFAVHAVQPASGPSWVFLGLQVASLIGAVAIGVPLLMDAAHRIRRTRADQHATGPAATAPAPAVPTAAELPEGGADGRR